MHTLKNKVIIVVGASGGIGSVLSRIFHEHGARVVLAARTRSTLLEVQQGVGLTDTLVVPTDATDIVSVQDLFAKTRDAFGHVDAVINTTGTWKQLSIYEKPEIAIALAKKHFDVFFMTSFVVGYVAQEFFREQEIKSGLIVNISSHAAIKPELPGNLTYGPMKAAARHFILALSHELKGSHVRVTDIAPAIVNTKGVEELLDTDVKKLGAVQPEEIANWIIQHFDDPDIPKSHVFESSVVV